MNLVGARHAEIVDTVLIWGNGSAWPESTLLPGYRTCATAWMSQDSPSGPARLLLGDPFLPSFPRMMHMQQDRGEVSIRHTSCERNVLIACVGKTACRTPSCSAKHHDRDNSRRGVEEER